MECVREREREAGGGATFPIRLIDSVENIALYIRRYRNYNNYFVIKKILHGYLDKI